MSLPETNVDVDAKVRAFLPIDRVAQAPPILPANDVMIDKMASKNAIISRSDKRMNVKLGNKIYAVFKSKVSLSKNVL